MSQEQTLLDYVRKEIDAHKGMLTIVARDSGVPYFTIAKIAQGAVGNPRIKTVQALADYFKSGISNHKNIQSIDWVDRINSYGQSKLAFELGIKPQAVQQWCASRSVPAERVIQVESSTGISRHDLRPDIYPRESVA